LQELALELCLSRRPEGCWRGLREYQLLDVVVLAATMMVNFGFEDQKAGQACSARKQKGHLVILKIGKLLHLHVHTSEEQGIQWIIDL
jgi:hypothetical protein